MTLTISNFYSKNFLNASDANNFKNCYPNPQQTPGGDGTPNDPITVAADVSQFAPGTYIYVPGLGKEFLVQDMCLPFPNGTTQTLCTKQPQPYPIQIYGRAILEAALTTDTSAEGVASDQDAADCINYLTGLPQSKDSLSPGISSIQQWQALVSSQKILGQASFSLPGWPFFDETLYAGNTPKGCWMSDGNKPLGVAQLPAGASVTCAPGGSASQVQGASAADQMIICTGLLPGDGYICHTYPNPLEAVCYYSGKKFSGGAAVPPGCSATDTPNAQNQGVICFDAQNKDNNFAYYAGLNWTCYTSPGTPIGGQLGMWCTVSGPWKMGDGTTVIALPAGCARSDPGWLETVKGSNVLPDHTANRDYGTGSDGVVICFASGMGKGGEMMYGPKTRPNDHAWQVYSDAGAGNDHFGAVGPAGWEAIHAGIGYDTGGDRPTGMLTK